jgi:hypothetical protein
MSVELPAELRFLLQSCAIQRILLVRISKRNREAAQNGLAPEIINRKRFNILRLFNLMTYNSIKKYKKAIEKWKIIVVKKIF